ncbi:penicillin-binding transpeptidase domain-containing protein [Nocardioides sp. AE5]|uniref:penicillin-binding transpeptidase domain-containing protein n=1 Tax=Nocardioides sp. AE5 TaxID=2962573 RepID=UPI00288284A7|nr:penicillin-binding transpeptidase domain-containing protein [Nocardioides sp. AE5]MDT0202987.1 penicillin-binding transpeptidase domain-containing protein [Nocardioides sp. AE5]
MRRSLVLPAVLALLAPLGACGLFGDDGDPGAVGTQLAEALTARDLADVPFTGAAGEVDDETPATAYDAIVADLADAEVVVTAATADPEGDKATTTLTWTWHVHGAQWTYQSTADLVRVEETWQVAWDPGIVEPSLVAGERLEVDLLTPRRGDILDRNGDPIVTNRDVRRLGLDKTKIEADQVTDSATAIAELLDVDVEAYVKRAEASGPKAFVEAIVLREEEARTIDPAYGDVPGAVSIGAQMPLAPTSTFAAPLLGRVGPATKELIDNSEGRLAAGDQTGLGGLQARYDVQLAGTRGIQVEAVGGEDGERELFATEPVDGTPLQLTLDTALQTKAETVLADVEPASAIVVLDPETGEILAAASGPGSGGQTTATAARYAPGSTFKVVTALALLRSGLTPESMVECPATVVVDGKTFKNYDDYPSGSLGEVTLREAFAQSCNTAFINERGELGTDDLADAAAALGLGVDHDLGFPAYFGQVPPAAGETEKAADQIGQGKVLASPMAMAAVAASVRSGHTVVPKLIRGYDVEQVAPNQPLTTDEARQLRTLMRAVVTEGPGSFLGDVPGEVEAKTGTAEYGTAEDGSLPTHAWMIGTTDDLAVAVFVETGESGSRTAGPLLEQMLR